MPDNEAVPVTGAPATKDDVQHALHSAVNYYREISDTRTSDFPMLPSYNESAQVIPKAQDLSSLMTPPPPMSGSPGYSTVEQASNTPAELQSISDKLESLSEGALSMETPELGSHPGTIEATVDTASLEGAISMLTSKIDRLAQSQELSSSVPPQESQGLESYSGNASAGHGFMADPLANVTPMDYRTPTPQMLAPSMINPYHSPMIRPQYETLRDAGYFQEQGGVLGAPGTVGQEFIPLGGAPVTRDQAGTPENYIAPEERTLSLGSNIWEGVKSGASSLGRGVAGAGKYTYEGLFRPAEVYEVDPNRPESRGLYGGIFGSAMEPSLLQAAVQQTSFGAVELSENRRMTALDSQRESARALRDYTADAGFSLGKGASWAAGKAIESVFMFDPLSPFRKRSEDRHRAANRSRAAIGDLYLGMDGQGLDEQGRVSVGGGYGMADSLKDLAITNKRDFRLGDLGELLQSATSRGLLDKTKGPEDIKKLLPDLVNAVDTTMRMRNLGTVDEAVEEMARYKRRGGDALGKDFEDYMYTIGAQQRMAGLSSPQASRIMGEGAAMSQGLGFDGNFGASQALVTYDVNRRLTREGAFDNFDIMRAGGAENFNRQALASSVQALQGATGSNMALMDMSQLQGSVSGSMGVSDQYLAAAKNLSQGDYEKNMLDLKFNREKILKRKQEELNQIEGPMAFDKIQMNQILNAARTRFSKSDDFTDFSESEYMEAAEFMDKDTFGSPQGRARSRQLYQLVKNPKVLRDMEKKVRDEKLAQEDSVKEMENSLLNRMSRGWRGFQESVFGIFDPGSYFGDSGPALTEEEKEDSFTKGVGGPRLERLLKNSKKSRGRFFSNEKDDIEDVAEMVRNLGGSFEDLDTSRAKQILNAGHFSGTVDI